MAANDDVGTCERILQFIVERGPITASELAKIMVLTPAAVRRHIATLDQDGFIQEYDGPTLEPTRRGRPSRRYVATSEGQSQLGDAYSDLATQALGYIRDSLGEVGVEAFVEQRTAALEKRYGADLASAKDVPSRVALLADALTRDGYVATVRPVGPEGFMLQLCQGHCPVQSVAAEFPELCEAETAAFSRLLGAHVQRLATLAGGEHVCTTNVPLRLPMTRVHAAQHTALQGVSEGNR